MSNDERINSLKKQLANAKRVLTNQIKFLAKFNRAKDLPVLEKRHKEVEDQRVIFETAQDELERLMPDDDKHESVRTEFDEKYYSCFSQMTLLKNPAFVNAPPSGQQSPGTSASFNNAEVTSVRSHKGKLPSLNLPLFSGGYDTWLAFHDLFTALIDNDKNISDIEKLMHLKGCLRNEAAEVLDSLEVSSENYRVAWALLKERYDNQKIIRQGHVKALLDLQVISKEFPVRSLLDQVQRHIRALQALKEPVESWDTVLVAIIKEKLNNFIREKWEDFSCESSNPTYKEMITFLKRRAQFEETKSSQVPGRAQNSYEKKSFSKNYRSQQSYLASATKVPCSHCEGDHLIYKCEKFKGLSPQGRFEAAKRASLCLNCLRSGHRVSACSLSPCSKCSKKHNILLHFEKKSSIESSDVESKPQNISTVNMHAHVSSEALLATAIVDLVNPQGESKACRVFLDAGSQANFITESAATFLKLRKTLVDVSVTGVEDTCTTVDHSVSTTLKSRFSKYEKKLDCFVLSRITKTMPSIQLNRAKLEIPKNIFLADPEFHKPAEVDLLIGVRLFYKLLCVGQIELKNHPDAILQKTQLGWIVAGEINGSSPINSVQCNFTMHSTPLELNLTKFWEIEEVPFSKPLSAEEEACEVHFKDNVQRNADGRYIVKLPFNENKNKIGESRSMASRRLNYLIDRFEKNPDLEQEYSKFLHEYEELNHMSQLKKENFAEPGFYFPHHAVVKKDSITTKVRVVFDGSAKTSSGVSLNDSLMVGPTIQDDLFTLLTRFRSHRYALTADIEKMYRQVLVHPDDAKYQRILFRKNKNDPVTAYTLNTLTYGTSCAPFLSIRALHQLAEDEGPQHPIAAAVLKRDFYVDDLLTGANTHQEAAFLRDDLIELLNKGGFPLRKWASNDPRLVAECSINPSSNHMSLDPNSTIKTLGIQWNSGEDTISYSVNLSDLPKQSTKRSILSQVAKLFDPLGLLGPVIVKAKIMIQLLWKAKVSWDESIPINVHTMWIEYKGQLPLLSNARFDRLIIVPNSIDIQMHGFCDASEKAYGACIYVRSTDRQGKPHVALVCCKSRVAPVSSVTLPRLELCAALLLARLYTATTQALKIEFSKVVLWSDATIALHWIHTSPHTLTTFVSNRIAKIQKLTASCKLAHVASQDNPADLVSRGQTPQEFLDSHIWRVGPHWLSLEDTCWPQKLKFASSKVSVKRSNNDSPVCMTLTIRETNLLEKYSSMEKLTRVIANLLRFVHNVKNKKDELHGPLSQAELAASNQIIIRLVQSAAFSKEIKSLKLGEKIDAKSRLIPLNSFIDNQGILRVGGRLTHSELPEEQKHPILLPASHHITRLVIRDEHLRLKHAGTQATLYSVRENYWPLDGRNVTRKIIYDCVPCFRVKPRDPNYIMGNLPLARVSLSRPFLNVGVDFCGPLYIKEKRFRNRNKIKVYVAVFVCMGSKAVHLELVSNLTTEAFIASLKRLFSRRGKSKTIYSDNGTNFVGASRELVELYKCLESDKINKEMQKYLESEKIMWKFIPPNSPHFGGLWEAAVKSFKHHLLRTVGDTLLTFEQLETYIIEIEAIMNSRPLSPMSSDPNDFHPLTPGHFLIGGPLTSFPQMDLKTTTSNHLSDWQHAQKMRQHFWSRWQKEYLNQLIVRSKWQSNNNHEIKLGTLVVIKDDNAPPLQWTLGRITAIHPGTDGIIRVATVKTVKGEYKRCIKRLCPLPIKA